MFTEADQSAQIEREYVMGKRKSKSSKVNVSSSAVNEDFYGGGLAGQLSAFASLGSHLEEEKGQEIDRETDRETDREISSPQDPLLSALGPRRVVKTAILKRGRGGKVVTTLQTVKSANEQSVDRLTKALGKGLGCRAWREDALIFLQGDQRQRITEWINAQP